MSFARRPGGTASSSCEASRAGHGGLLEAPEKGVGKIAGTHSQEGD
jgi:hypothetical protein